MGSDRKSPIRSAPNSRASTVTAYEGNEWEAERRSAREGRWGTSGSREGQVIVATAWWLQQEDSGLALATGPTCCNGGPLSVSIAQQQPCLVPLQRAGAALPRPAFIHQHPNLAPQSQWAMDPFDTRMEGAATRHVSQRSGVLHSSQGLTAAASSRWASDPVRPLLQPSEESVGRARGVEGPASPAEVRAKRIGRGGTMRHAATS